MPSDSKPKGALATVRSLMWPAFVAFVVVMSANLIELYFRSANDPYIVLHDLTFERDPKLGPSITQDRTATGVRPVMSVWTTTIRGDQDNQTYCTGAGSWRYPLGRRTPTVPFDDWVGVEGCWDQLPLDTPLQACVTFETADDLPVAGCTVAFFKTAIDISED